MDFKKEGEDENMQLYINSPCYYKNVFGVDDEIYWFCREISNFVVGKSYSDIVDSIGMSPIIAPAELIEKGMWKEETQYHLKSKLIIVKKHTDYIKYVEGTMEEKKKLMVGNILKSINSVKRKGKINYIQFESDLLTFLGYTKEEMIEHM